MYPIHEDVAENLADHLSYHSDLMMFQSELKANLEHFVKNGTVQPFQKISASQIYTFTEDYRLTGQHFDLEDTDGNLVYEIFLTSGTRIFTVPSLRPRRTARGRLISWTGWRCCGVWSAITAQLTTILSTPACRFMKRLPLFLC